jgi:hypothetical protein
MGRHDLKNEAKSEKNSAAPPAGGGQKISRLPYSDKGVWRRACSAKIGGEPRPLPALEQDRKDEDDAVEDEQREKKRVKHWEDLSSARHLNISTAATTLKPSGSSARW